MPKKSNVARIRKATESDTWQFRREQLRDGSAWGRWNLDRKQWILRYVGEREDMHAREYLIPLQNMKSSAGMLDSIFQLAGKRWMNPQDLFDLIRALDAIFYPQANLCSWGKDKRLNAPEYLQKRLAA